MGSRHSKQLEKELKFLSEQTDMSIDQLRDLHEVFSMKNTLTKEEFVANYKKIFPR